MSRCRESAKVTTATVVTSIARFMR
jgi:hypothetical protein